jgi:hypothetical protein
LQLLLFFFILARALVIVLLWINISTIVATHVINGGLRKRG